MNSSEGDGYEVYGVKQLLRKRDFYDKEQKTRNDDWPYWNIFP